METENTNQISEQKNYLKKIAKAVLILEPILWVLLLIIFYIAIKSGQYNPGYETLKNYLFYSIIILSILGLLLGTILFIANKKTSIILALFLLFISLVPLHFLLLSKTLAQIESFGSTTVRLNTVPLDLKEQYKFMVDKVKNPLKLTDVKPSQNGPILIFENNFALTLKSSHYLNYDEMLVKVEKIKSDGLLGQSFKIVPPDEKNFIINNCCTNIYYKNELINDKYR